MTDKEKIELYNLCSCGYDYLYKNDDEYHNELCQLLYYCSDKQTRLFKSNEITDDMKIKMVDSLSNMVDKIKSLNDIKSLKNIIFLIINIQLNHYIVGDLLKLNFFPEDCFNDNQNDGRYLFIIEQILTFEDYYICNLLKKYPLFSLVTTYMDYIYDNHLDYNVFMPNIILYCLKEKYDKDKFIKVIENAYNSYDYLLGFYELNDDEYHTIELDNSIVSKIIDGSINERIIR